MQNEAWADDPDLRVLRDDDADSQKLKRFGRRWIWPGPRGLIVLALLVGFVIETPLTVAAWQWLASIWLAGQMLGRPTNFLLSVRDGFGKATALLASLFGQRDRRDEPTPKDVRAFMPQAGEVHAAEAVATPTPTAQPTPARPPAKRINWLEVGDQIIRFWPLILFLVVLAVFWQPIDRLINGASGREVAAEANAGVARSEARTSDAEAQRGTDSIIIVETTHRGRTRARAETEEALEAVANAPDLDASFVEYDTRARSLRDEGRTAVADAVQQHAASIER